MRPQSSRPEAIITQLADRFWSKVNRHGPVHPILKTRCWLWTGRTLAKKLYGRLKFNGKEERAHRIAWFITYGKWPKPHALHHCDNPICVRPSHLFEGGQAENMKDMRLKGRESQVYGSKHGRAVLTESDVLAIREIHNKGEMLQQELADIFQVTSQSISNIVNGRTWTNV